MWLHCGGERYRLIQVGGDQITVAGDFAIVGGPSSVEVIIDGISSQFQVTEVETQRPTDRLITVKSRSQKVFPIEEHAH